MYIIIYIDYPPLLHVFFSAPATFCVINTGSMNCKSKPWLKKTGESMMSKMDIEMILEASWDILGRFY